MDATSQSFEIVKLERWEFKIVNCLEAKKKITHSVHVRRIPLLFNIWLFKQRSLILKVIQGQPL